MNLIADILDSNFGNRAKHAEIAGCVENHDVGERSEAERIAETVVGLRETENGPVRTGWQEERRSEGVVHRSPEYWTLEEAEAQLRANGVDPQDLDIREDVKEIDDVDLQVQDIREDIQEIDDERDTDEDEESVITTSIEVKIPLRWKREVEFDFEPDCVLWLEED